MGKVFLSGETQAVLSGADKFIPRALGCAVKVGRYRTPAKRVALTVAFAKRATIYLLWKGLF